MEIKYQQWPNNHIKAVNSGNHLSMLSTCMNTAHTLDWRRPAVDRLLVRWGGLLQEPIQRCLSLDVWANFASYGTDVCQSVCHSVLLLPVITFIQPWIPVSVISLQAGLPVSGTYLLADHYMHNFSGWQREVEFCTVPSVPWVSIINVENVQDWAAWDLTQAALDYKVSKHSGLHIRLHSCISLSNFGQMIGIEPQSMALMTLMGQAGIARDSQKSPASAICSSGFFKFIDWCKFQLKARWHPHFEDERQLPALSTPSKGTPVPWVLHR